MNRHPGGEEQTLHLLKSIELKKGMKALDLGAGEGETVRIMKAFGLNVQGVDLAPRSSEVQRGDFLDLQYAADSMDLCISQCAFFVSRDQKNALSEKGRISFTVRSGSGQSFGNCERNRVYDYLSGGPDCSLERILSGRNLE